MTQETDIAAETFKRIDDIGDAMKRLAMELKVPAGELFEALCLREQIEGSFVAALGVAVLIAVSFGYRWLYRQTTADDYDPATEMDAVMCMGASLLIPMSVGLMMIGFSLNRIFVPEVAAIESIMEMVK